MSKPDLASLEKTIESAFEERDAISTATRGETRDAIQSALDLSGSFESEWTVDCRTRLVGFTGGHYTHDSPYCQSLTF